MTHRLKIDQVAPRDQNMALIAELAGIMSDLANMQVRVSRLFKHLSTTGIMASAPTNSGIADENRNPQCPSNRDGSADGEASSGVVPQDEAPQAGTGSEMLADREGRIAKGAGEEHASAPNARPTQKDRVLDVYASTTLNQVEIAGQTGDKLSSVRAQISLGRKAKDERVLKGDAARAAARAAFLATDPDETFAAAVALTAPEPPRTVAPKSKPAADDGPPRFRPPSASPVKAMAPKAFEAPAVQVKPSIDIDADVIMVVDEANLQIYGPLGALNVSRPLACSLTRLQDGNLYDNKLLQAVGEWPSETSMKDHFRAMRSKLARIGVDLFEVKNFGFKARRLEGSNA